MSRFAAATFAIAAAAGCVSEERSDMAAARAAYEQCVADQAGGDRDCAALRERMLAVQQRYESNARRAWGCAPEQGDCPAHR